jgi:hypothetical protein
MISRITAVNQRKQAAGVGDARLPKHGQKPHPVAPLGSRRAPSEKRGLDSGRATDGVRQDGLHTVSVAGLPGALSHLLWVLVEYLDVENLAVLEGKHLDEVPPLHFAAYEQSGVKCINIVARSDRFFVFNRSRCSTGVGATSASPRLRLGVTAARTLMATRMDPIGAT